MKNLELNIDNATLVQECRRGDRDAMSILYTRFAPRMLRVISRYVSDHDCARDILHDGFIAAFTRLDTLRDPERLDFWLATIMKNLSLKFLQAQSVSSILEEIPETTDEPDTIETLDFATLESLIRKLPKGYQKVFRLAVLEGKSHKEISEILGIAPHSSSSQLSHAKLRLRQLIKDYQLSAGLLSLLLLLVSASFLFIGHDSDTTDYQDHFAFDKTPEKQGSSSTQLPDTTKETESNQPMIHTVTAKPVFTQAISRPSVGKESYPSEDIASEPPIISDTESSVETDSTSVVSPSEKPPTSPIAPVEEEYGSSYDRLFAELPRKSSVDKGWSAGILVDPGLLSFNSIGGDFVSDNHPSLDPENPPYHPDEDDSNSVAPSKIPTQNASDIESYLGTSARHHHLPISFALTAEKRFTSWLGVESGIGYSYLHTDFERSTLNGNEVSTCHWHYLEVPLKVNLYAYSNPRVKLYGSFGGRVAMPVYSYASIPANPYCQSGRFNSKIVWSVGGSVGVAFRLSKRVDLFIEPSLRYYFPQDCTLPNIWTDDEPFSLSIPLGLRLSW